MTETGNRLEDRIRTYYAAQSLDDATLQSLRTTATGRGRARRQAVRAIWLAAALFLVALGVLRGPWSAEQIERPVAAEIALNHNKQLEPEFLAAEFGGLHGAMPKLDFAPVEPRRLRNEGHRLAGARYCSVGGRIAAQIRLVDARGRNLTLYQFRAGDRYDRLTTSDFDFDGVRVTIWQEAGLVMGLARPLD